MRHFANTFRHVFFGGDPYIKKPWQFSDSLMLAVLCMLIALAVAVLMIDETVTPITDVNTPTHTSTR